MNASQQREAKQKKKNNPITQPMKNCILALMGLVCGNKESRTSHRKRSTRTSSRSSENSTHPAIHDPIPPTNKIDQNNCEREESAPTVPGNPPIPQIAEHESNDHRSKFSDMKELEDCLVKGTNMVEPRASECVERTRKGILADVSNKIDSLDSANIICIYGAPGTGKSSVSLTIKSRLQDQGRLVTYFRFDRTEAATTTSSALWRHVGYELADRYPSVRMHSLSLLREKKLDRTSTPTELFTSLVMEPLLIMSEPLPDQPIVIIVDALDECGGRDSRSSPDRHSLLQTLRCWPKLPKYVKLLVISRRETDIHQVLSSSNSATIYIPSGNFLTDNPNSQASIDASADIRTFLDGRFRQTAERLSLGQHWPGSKIIADMVLRAAGNFMWAVTVTNLVDSSPNPKEQLTKIVDPTSNSSGMEPLFSLYRVILETSFRNIVDDDAKAIQAVLGSIVYAKRPLSDEEYTKLPTPNPIRPVILRSIRDDLGSVLVEDTNLRFVHKSFNDFLLSDACPEQYRVKSDESQHLLAKLCITTMTTELHFDLCNLGTSYLKNVDVPDIGTKTKDGISRLLSYSCCFWAEHLVRASVDDRDSLVLEVKEMIFDKLLYWFEAMSYLEEVNRVSNALQVVLDWSESASDKDLTNFLQDARRFIGAFIYPITQSAPHIYLSALPFAPEQSLVTRQFRPRFSQTLAVSTGKTTKWSSCVFTSEHHDTSVDSVAFSPDDKSFVSQSQEPTIRIRDSDTGHPISNQFRGTDRFLGSFFDPDGRCVWAYCRDGQVIGWDLETGNKHLTFQAASGGDEGRIIGCCVNHRDGSKNIIVVSSFKPQPEDPMKGIVTLWSTDTGEKLKDLFTFDDPGPVVSFSPDGVYMAHTEINGTDAMIWKLTGGSEIKRLFDSRDHTFPGHKDRITTLSFSVDGAYAVGGTYGGTVLIWDLQSGSVVGSPLATPTVGSGGLGNAVTAVAYSHTTKILVSSTGFGDMRLMVWNASTRQAILGPLRGHTGWVTSIALSRDGRRVLSASTDKTVRMWDLGGGTNSPTPVDGTNKVVWVTFSPRGDRLVSKGDDHKIRVWNARTGEQIFSTAGYEWRRSQVIFSPNGGEILVYTNGEDGRTRFKMWNVDTGELVFQHVLINKPKDKGLPSIAFRPTDHQVVACSTSGIMRALLFTPSKIVENLSISRIQPKPAADSRSVKFLALSPDGLTALAYEENQHKTYCYYSLWSTTTSMRRPLSFGDGESISMASFSHCEGLVAVSNMNIFRVWNTRTGKLTMGPSRLDDINIDTKGGIQRLALLRDNCHVALSYRPPSDATSIWIWNICTGRLVSGPWKGHTKDVGALAFSEDGKKLASGSKDGQIRVWDTADLVGDSSAQALLVGPTKRVVSDGTRIEKDGWVVNERGELLFWVPNDHRDGLSWGRGVSVMSGKRIPTQLDTTRFVHGEKWKECSDERGGEQE